MEISGKILQILTLQQGEGKNGQWRKQDFILETSDRFPKKVCISVWGDKIDQFNLEEGTEVTVSVNIESREYNEKWYTDVKAWRIQQGIASQEDEFSTSSNNFPPPPPPSLSDIPGEQSEDDDLPF